MADGRRAGWTGEKPNIAPNKPVSPRRILSQLVSRNQWNGLSGQPKCDSQRPGATLCDVGDLTTDQKVGGSNPFERTFERTFKRAKPAGQAAHLLAYPSRVFSQTQQPASSPPAGPSGWVAQSQVGVWAIVYSAIIARPQLAATGRPQIRFGLIDYASASFLARPLAGG